MCRIKCRKCGAESYAAGDTGLVCIRCYDQQAERTKELEVENKRLKKKIKKVCIGIDAPKFEPDAGNFMKLDLEKPELAYLWGWESAILECGEILSKP